MDQFGLSLRAFRFSSVSVLFSTLFPAAGSCFRCKPSKNIVKVCCPAPNIRQSQLIKHLSYAKRQWTLSGVGGDQNKDKRKVNIELTFLRSAATFVLTTLLCKLCNTVITSCLQCPQVAKKSTAAALTFPFFIQAFVIIVLYPYCTTQIILWLIIYITQVTRAHPSYK